MKRKNTISLLAAFLLSALLSGCGSDLVSLQYENGMFVNAKEELSYIPAEITYEPVSVGEAYAYYPSADLTLYTIGENDPSLWLTEAYADGATTVFHADSITLPTFSAFGADRVTVCDASNVTIGICEITDAALIQQLVSIITDGEEAEWPLVGATLRYDMKFASPDWPQIYMNLIYGEFPEGNYLYERASGRAVEIGDLLDEYLHPDKALSAEAAS